MSLLDDVSIVVTPNGYKAGELYAVIPVPTEGAEEVINGDFATDSDWSKGTGVTISSGNAIFNNSTANNNGIYQAAVFQANTQYKITAEVSNYSSGNVTAWSGGSQNSTSNESFTGNGIKTWIISTGASNGYFILSSATTNGNFNIDNVSVKEYTSADMDVTRATAATRVDENGLVNYAEIIGGEEIDNGKFTTNLDSWSTSSWWVWNSLGAYHPSTSLHKPLYQQCCVIGKTYLITFDLNCVGLSLAKFSLGSSTGSTTQTIDINLTTGSYSYFVTAAAEYIVFNRQNTAEYYVNNISVKEVTRDNVPRIDYTGGGCPHILAEPQRTNLLTYSEDFSNAVWSEVSGGVASNPVLTNDYAISPDGTENATRCLFDMGGGATTSDYSRLRYLNLTATTPVISLYIKSNNANTYKLNFSYGGDSTFLVDAKPNEWTRVDKSTTASGSFDYRLELRGGSTSDDTADVLIWGAQAESNESYATSYIPTSGSTVTRNQDIFTRDGIGSLINSTEGVLFVEMALLIDDDSNKYITLTDVLGANKVQIDFDYSSSRLQYVVASGGYAQCNIKISYSGTNMDKLAFKWKENDFAVWINGVEIGSDTSGLAPIGLNTLKFSAPTGSNNFAGKVKQLQVYDTSLSDEQLLQLTGESGTDFYESYAEMASALTYTIQ